MDVPHHVLVFVQGAHPLVIQQIVVPHVQATVQLHVQELVIGLAPEGVVEMLSIN